MRRLFLAGALLGFLFISAGFALPVTKIQYQAADLGSGRWQYTYDVTNISLTPVIETESTLVDQPLKTQLEYRVIAINKAGVGSPSNTVMAVL